MTFATGPQSTRSLRSLLAACGAAVLLAACGGEDATVRTVEFPVDQAQNPVRVGSAESSDPDATIGHVIAARVTASGDRVVVLDFAPPYVKVFRRDGTLERAFLSEGDGPREMRHPSALAVAGDSLVMVAGGARRLAVFGMDGQPRAEGRTGFPVLAAVEGCDGEWIAYGPTFRTGDQSAWLHRIRMGPDSMRVADLEFREARGDGMIGQGLAYGIARAGDTMHVWHVLTEAPAVLGWACGQARPHAWAVRPLSQRTAAERDGKAVRMTIEPGQRMLAGMAAVPGGVVLAAHVVPAAGKPATTELTLVTAKGEHTVAVTGAYTLRDSHPRLGVLVNSDNPAPRLFTISPADLQALFANNR